MYPRNYDDLNSLKTVHRLPLSDLIVLSATLDPFYRGSSDAKKRAGWFSELYRDHVAAGHPGRHIRALHYSALSQGKLLPDGRPYASGDKKAIDKDWLWLNVSAAHARYAGLVDPHKIRDRRSKDAFWTPSREAGWERDDSSVELSALKSSHPEVASDLAFWLYPPTEPEVRGYGYSLQDQPVALSIWVEKSGPEDVLLPVCERLGVSLVVGTGYQSITRIVDFLRRMSEDGRPVRIGYISDYDPAGENMPRQVARQIEFWIMDLGLDIDVALQPLLLNADQIAPGGLTVEGLPLVPGKERDVVELDAVPIFAPGAMEQIVSSFVALYRDDELKRNLQLAEEEAKDTATNSWLELTESFNSSCEALEEEAATLLEPYNEQLREINEMLQVDLASVKERTLLLQEAAAVRADWWAEEVADYLPEVPQAEVTMPDEDEYLFSSERDYLEQLAAYRRHKGQVELGSDRIKTCEWWECGTEFQARNMKQKTCSGRCKTALSRWSAKFDAKFNRDWKAGRYGNDSSEDNSEERS
jgi:hypothetical protein